MADYIYPDDGKIHLRYSELKRCTPGQVDKVVLEKLNGTERYESEAMRFGTTRHEMWKQESLQTGMVPVCFKEVAGGRFYVPVTYVERELVAEIAPGIVIHSRPDGICCPSMAIYDGKTVVDGLNGYEGNLSHYNTSEQALFYAYMCAVHNIPIKETWYLCEIWNQARDEIIERRAITRQIDLLKISTMQGWAIKRAALFKTVWLQHSPVIH